MLTPPIPPSESNFDICDFISRVNPVTAQRLSEELIKQSEAMAVFPQSGRLVPEKKDPRMPLS